MLNATLWVVKQFATGLLVGFGAGFGAWEAYRYIQYFGL